MFFRLIHVLDFFFFFVIRANFAILISFYICIVLEKWIV